jgi:hypothetical protein
MRDSRLLPSRNMHKAKSSRGRERNAWMFNVVSIQVLNEPISDVETFAKVNPNCGPIQAVYSSAS